jgi:hypothetical protein
VLRFALPILLLLFFAGNLMAQTERDSVEQSAFRKGRNLVGVTGSISSAYLNNANSSSQKNQIGNLYRFNVRLGKFVAHKNVVGLMFLASRTELVGYINSKAEVMALGPWYRLYLGKVPNIAFYLQPSLLYASYFGESDGGQALQTIDEDLDLHGVRGGLGIGISYVMGDRVSFDVGCEYNQARYWGRYTDHTLNLEQDIVLNRGEFVFSFGFNVLFERLRRDD